MNIEKLKQITSKRILVFGDFMVDKYIMGSVNRISPEAPVPVINVKEEQIKLGGAGNVVNNLISLGANVRVLGCCGDDYDGRFIKNYFSNQQVDVNYFKLYSELKTITKTRIVSKKHQFARLDEEYKRDLPNEYYEYIKRNISSILENIDAIIISDYAKGAVNEDFAQLLISQSKKRNIPVIIDPKGSNYSKYRGATLCTPNMKELCDVIGRSIETEEEILKYSNSLIKNINLEYLIVTRSENGISLIHNSKKYDFPAKAKDVIDVSGAGDTVVAAIALLITIGFSMDEVCKLANVAASVVVSKFGTATLSLDEMISNIASNTDFKLLKPITAKYIINELKNKGKRIVFTNGCFDLLHAGHLSSFKQAKKFGDILIVAVNSDLSVKENKGDLRPIVDEKDRIDMISALEVVDYVILMDDKTPENLISIIQPDVCVKGEDWKEKEMPEKKIINSYGGKLEFIKLEKDKSTTQIIEKVLKAYEKK